MKEREAEAFCCPRLFLRLIQFCEQVWLYRHVPVALYLRLAPQKLITETATEALALVAILSLQLNECLRIACGFCFDTMNRGDRSLIQA